MANLWKREKGQSLVELALLFPILLIILLGIIDFGRVFYAYVTITNAAREGARYGSLHPSAADIRDYVRQEAQPFLDDVPDEDIEVNLCWVGCDPNPNGSVTVRVEYYFQTLFFGNLPYIRDWFPAEGKIPISAQTVMPIVPPAPTP